MERGKKYSWSPERGLFEVGAEPKREVEAPSVMPDEMEPMQSMVDCKFYTSKSAYRRSLKEQGYIEVGNDVDGFKKTNVFETKEYDAQLKEDLTRSYYECRDKMAPVSEWEREKFRRMDRNSKRYGHDRRERGRNGRTRD